MRQYGGIVLIAEKLCQFHCLGSKEDATFPRSGFTCWEEFLINLNDAMDARVFLKKLSVPTQDFLYWNTL
jgi:hypothetical protein